MEKYSEAVKTLNTLQTNAQVLEKIRSQRDRFAHLNVPNMIKFSQRAGISLADIDSLKIIHVSGTKGKGSTCAFCESILLHHGYKTGFYSSPHLIEVRERIHINGQPLDRERFTSYFWDVYNKLDKTKAEHENSMPGYFAFLTVMAFHVFLQEKVDVGIIEVGIGGQYDSTNLIQNPIACGVTSLGLDHTSILGNTVDKIAWHKAGIFKPGVPAVTAPQPALAMNVLKERAKEIGCPLHVCPDIEEYDAQGKDLQLGIKGEMQSVNASLALQLCHIWLGKVKRHNENGLAETITCKGDAEEMPKDYSFPLTEQMLQDNENGLAETIACKGDAEEMPKDYSFPLTEQMLQGLATCRWAGRNQTIEAQNITYYLDGAHTLESIQQCVNWFREDAEKEKKSLRKTILKVLIFNTTGDRDSYMLLRPLKACDFDLVVFCPNIASLRANNADQTNNTVTLESQMKRCLLNKESWDKLFDLENDGDQESLLNVAAEGSSHVISDPTPANKTRIDVTNGQQENTSAVTDKDVKHENQMPDTATNGHFSSFFSSESCDNQSQRFNQALEKLVPVSHCLPSISHALALASQGKTLLPAELNDMPELPSHFKSVDHVQILITGSIHLVGGALRIIQDIPDDGSETD
ncbi:hypothetical protein CHS0354_001556 [Potamilus streckersoni]|uniref:tetrahydrofolate synthase n=1 Tax=Potamilus streckersoni TaxID=2493646 RepID=A0AAE0SN44_9BIVA|nr:hypothetical protein CHS0354_001556 [Potamilus streckersoni]